MRGRLADDDLKLVSRNSPFHFMSEFDRYIVPLLKRRLIVDTWTNRHTITLSMTKWNDNCMKRWERIVTSPAEGRPPLCDCCDDLLTVGRPNKRKFWSQLATSVVFISVTPNPAGNTHHNQVCNDSRPAGSSGQSPAVWPTILATGN